ncbi:MAG: DUF1501 domain-containing protein [Bacteroidota bacterium]
MEKQHDKHTPIHPKAKRQLQKSGATLINATEHRQEHETWDRRTFLKMTGLTALGNSMLLGSTPVQAFSPNALLNSLALDNCGDRILVLIRLKGGNDGLNTIIQRGDDIYYNIRPSIATTEANLWGLSDEYGMPNELIDLQPLWEGGRMKVIHNVGYPNPNYSHFRSSDIWASASASNEIETTGWLGRWLYQDLPAFLTAPPVVPPALQIGIQANMLFRAEVGNLALAISNPAEFYQIAQSGSLYETGLLGNAPNEQELKYVRTVANSAFRYSESIQAAYNAGNNQVAYPDNYLAEQLAIVARMIKGNLGTKVYMVSIDGFDTHNAQLDLHPLLLNYLGSSIAAFFNDLDASGHSPNVLGMTFSEFGRTIYENASQGTDHGTGAPLFLFGNELGSTFHGESPNLAEVDQYGDPRFSVDFRSVYTNVLRNWLCAPQEVTDHILGDELEMLEDLLPATEAPVGSREVAILLGHNPADVPGVAFELKFAIQQRGVARISILNKAGQAIRMVFNQFMERGSHTFIFKPNDFFLSSGEYFYRLEAGGRAYTRAIVW